MASNAYLLVCSIGGWRGCDGDKGDDSWTIGRTSRASLVSCGSPLMMTFRASVWATGPLTVSAVGACCMVRTALGGGREQVLKVRGNQRDWLSLWEVY